MPCHRNAPTATGSAAAHPGPPAHGRNPGAAELTPAQSHVLHYLVEHRAQCPGPRDVEEFFSLTHPTVSGILSRLEAKGFVSFRTDRDDRRCKRIHVSEKALTCDGQIHDYIEALEKQMVQDFTPEEQAQFSSLLDRAIQNLGGEPGIFHKLHKKEDALL